MRLALENEEVGLELCGRLVNNLRFADDINLMSETTEGLQKITYKISQQGERLGLVINSDEIKVMKILLLFLANLHHLGRVTVDDYTKPFSLLTDFISYFL